MTTIKTQVNNIQESKIFVWTLVAAIFCGIFTYGYMVRSAIVNVVERENIERQIQTLNSRVLELEDSYVKIKNKVTLESAHGDGFVSVNSPIFVSASANTSAGLSVNIR